MTFSMVTYILSTCVLLTLVISRYKDLADNANLQWSAWFLSTVSIFSLFFEPEMVLTATAAVHSIALFGGLGIARAAIALLTNVLLGLWSLLVLAQLGLVFGYIGRQMHRRYTAPAQRYWELPPL